VNKLKVNVIHFVHFHARFSSRQGCGGSSSSRTWNTSRSTAISDSSAGSTPRRYQASLGLGRSIWATYRDYSQQDLPRQSFVGHSGHMAELYRSCDLSIRGNGSTFRALRISQLGTLSRSVTATPWTLRKNLISAACTRYNTLSVITQDSRDHR